MRHIFFLILAFNFGALIPTILGIEGKEFLIYITGLMIGVLSTVAWIIFNNLWR